MKTVVPQPIISEEEGVELLALLEKDDDSSFNGFGLESIDELEDYEIENFKVIAGAENFPVITLNGYPVTIEESKKLTNHFWLATFLLEK